jgi:Rod binding domain-containing protein
MECINPNLNHRVLSGTRLDTEKIKAEAVRTPHEQFAKDFESVFLERLLDEMKNTIGDWGFEQDGTSQQVHGLFWMQLARDMANQGGLGMWKEISQSLDRTPENPHDLSQLNDIL